MERTQTEATGTQTPLNLFKQAWLPSQREDSYAVTEIEGEIPKALRGTLYRNGPSQRILPKRGYEALHLFDGDGLVHALELDDGHLRYHGRFVRNESYLAEQAAGVVNQMLFGVAADQQTDKIALRRQPNTNVVFHHGKLYALVENAPPFELDPHSLDAVGYDTFGGRMLGMSTSAHPKIDGKTGEMLIHGYQFAAPFASLYSINARGECTLAEPVELDIPAMIHDLAITERYAILPVCPLLFVPKFDDRGFVGVPADWTSWRPELGLRFAVRARTPGAPLNWFTAPTPGFIFHVGNAYEAGDTIYMDACVYRDGGKLMEDLRTFRAGIPGQDSRALPVLYELNLLTGACKETWLSDNAAEFPRIDERRVGYPNRYGYALTGERGLSDLARLSKYDRQGGRAQHFAFPPDEFPGEPLFTPAHPGAAEDEGFVLTLVSQPAEDRSYLAIFDATQIASGPLARARLKHRVPLGFHGNFVPKSTATTSTARARF